MSGADQPESIVCLGEEREVRRGNVACPLRTEDTTLDDCAACRLLTWRPDDRVGRPECSTEPAPASV